MFRPLYGFRESSGLFAVRIKRIEGLINLQDGPIVAVFYEAEPGPIKIDEIFFISFPLAGIFCESAGLRRDAHERKRVVVAEYFFKDPPGTHHMPIGRDEKYMLPRRMFLYDLLGVIRISDSIPRSLFRINIFCGNAVCDEMVAHDIGFGVFGFLSEDAVATAYDDRLLRYFRIRMRNERLEPLFCIKDRRQRSIGAAAQNNNGINILHKYSVAE